MEKLTTFNEFINESQLNEGRVELSKDVLDNVNTFLKSLGVKTLVKKDVYVDSQGGFTTIGQSSLKDKELGDLAISFTLVWTNAHISVDANKVTLMIDTAAKTHNSDSLKTIVYWESNDNGKNFKAKR
jgi:hypothetical protein